ncbi:thermonuclease family protein [Tardiphaga sp. 20_F10_N6_6]|uniref:thermonuclease family protein n=1 Tax=unclassified Tardiphaga TaxID=2631404 RepID=UPI003F1E706C
MRAASAKCDVSRAATLLLAVTAFSTSAQSASAACMFAAQGEGRVADVIDVRTLRLSDGNVIRLAGIEPIANSSGPTNDLFALASGRDVTLYGESDMPDRYGRQPAFVFVDPTAPSLQAQLLAQGAALASGAISDKACAAELAAAEGLARRLKRGIWAQTNVIKNAESPGDILADVGRFGVVEGRVLSVRQAGTVTYVNFGRRWTEDFAVTVSRRMIAAFETTGIMLKSLERRHIRVRGWIERRGGPRIEALGVWQIEVVGDK